MKYIITFIFLLTSTHSKRSTLSFRPLDDVQFERHTSNAIDKIFDDPELSRLFPISDFFYSSTRFWFLIYSYFDDQKLIIHDRNNLNLVYQIQDFSSLSSKNVHRFAQSYIQEELIKKKLKDLKELLLKLAQDPAPKDPELISLYDRIVRAGVVLGDSATERSLVFKSLANNLRYQRGLRNHIEEGLARYNHYHLFLDNYFQEKGLPKELIAISFLESSFNPHAHSKSSAIGVWQFMPFLQNSFFPKHKKIDYRLNIGISSIAAAALLRENFSILKDWDLAVTAYNSGIKHILKEKRKNPDLNLEILIRDSEYSNFGFASKNFYAEFLALTRVLKYREELFPQILGIQPMPQLHFYITKCDANLQKIFNKDQRMELNLLNHHIHSLTSIPKGTLLTSDSVLSAKYFAKISWNDLLRKKPKLWMNPRKVYNCSTK